MFPLPWYAIVLISIPQIVCIIVLGFRLFGREIDYQKCVMVAVLGGIFTYFIRRTSLLSGAHTILLIIIITVLVTVINRDRFWHNLASIMLGSMIMGTLEGIWCPVFLDLISRSYGDLASYPWLNIVGFIPIIVFAIGIMLLIKRYDFVVYNLGKRRF